MTSPRALSGFPRLVPLFDWAMAGYLIAQKPTKPLETTRNHCRLSLRKTLHPEPVFLFVVSL